MRRPVVLHLRASNFVGGPESQLLRYAEADLNGPCEIVFGIYVGAEEGQEFRQAAQSRGIRVISLTVGSAVTTVRELTRIVRENAISLICTHGFKADVFGILAGRLAKVPVACFLRGWTKENRRVRLYEALDRCLLRFADRVVCLSDSQAKRQSEKRSLSSKIRIVTNAKDVRHIDESVRTAARKELLRRFNLPEESILIATAGRLSPEKATGDFLDAAALVKREVSKVRFLIFGSGALQHQLEEKTRKLDLQHCVTFAGFERDLKSLLPGLDILVNPSRSEEMPNVVLEGMAVGTPVIATAVGGVGDIAGPEGAVWLVPPAQPVAQAQAMIELLHQPQRKAELAKAGQERAKKFNVEKQREQLQELYAEFLPLRTPVVEHPSKDLFSIPSKEKSSAEDSNYDEWPFVSVVLPVRNEEDHVREVLSQLQEQNYPSERFEVLVAVGPSTDKTFQAIEDFRQTARISIRQFENSKGLSSAGRNLGALEARGEYIIFVDGHCQIPTKTLLRDAILLFEANDADCLCRPQPLTMEGNSFFQNVVAHARATALGHGRDSTIYTTDYEGPVDPCSAGAMYRRSVFDRVGYYDESFDACEDVEFNYRVLKAGLSCFISPKLTIYYRPRGTVVSLWRQMVRYGRGRFRLIQKHPEAFSWSQVIPAAFLAGLLVGPVFFALSRPLALVFALLVASYGVMVSAFSLRLARRHGFGHLLAGPIVFLTIHAGLGAGFFREALRWLKRTPREGTSASGARKVNLPPKHPSSVET
jgi:succinoglycan biosynthesis protein ExoA